MYFCMTLANHPGKGKKLLAKHNIMLASLTTFTTFCIYLKGSSDSYVLAQFLENDTGVLRLKYFTLSRTIEITKYKSNQVMLLALLPYTPPSIRRPRLKTECSSVTQYPRVHVANDR